MLRTTILVALTIVSATQAFLSPATHQKASRLYANYDTVFVAGGSKGVGRLVIDKLLAEGRSVKALIRSEDVAAELTEKGVTVTVGDALDQKTVENAMDGCDAAITTLGGSTANPEVDYVGNNHVIESAGILGVTRVLLVTSIGCGSSHEAAPPSTFEVLKEVLTAKTKAEQILQKYYTNTNWTIIRPGGLVTEAATGKAILTEDVKAIGSIHREDLASLVLQAMDSPKTERKVLSAVDPTVLSPARVEGQEMEAFAL